MVNDGNGTGESRTHGSEDRAESNNGNGVSTDRRTFLKATGASGLVASFAGCSQNGGSGGSGGDGGDGGSGDGGGDGGDGGSGDGGDGGSTGGGGNNIPDTVKIGVLAPAPSNNPIGASLANGARLAAQQINEDGGIDGSQIEVVVKDTQENPSTGRTKYQELTVGEEVHATFGPFTSEVLLAIMDSIAQQETIHMTTGAATPEASALVNQQYDQYKYHFRTGPINAHHLGQNMVDFADDQLSALGWESVAVLVEDYKWTEPLQPVLDDQLGGVGVDVAMSRRYASGTENFGPIYDAVEDAGADAAYIAMAHTGTAALVQWAQQQRPFAFGGIHVPAQLPQYFAATNGACNTVVAQNVATPQSEVTEKTVPFSNAFKEEFGSFPVYTGYITNDAVKQWAGAVESEGTVDSDTIVSALEDSSFTGTGGTIEYYPPDHEFAHDVVYERDKVWPVYQQWQTDDEGNGVQEVLYPDDLQTAEYVAPPWL